MAFEADFLGHSATPDGQGYHSATGKPSKQFIDITESGTELVPVSPGGGGNLDYGDGYSEVRLSSPVLFYGQEFNKIFVDVNGFVGFKTLEYIDGSDENTNLPSKNFPHANLAALWQDLYISDPSSSGIYYKDDPTNHRFIVEWNNLSYGTGSSNGSATFELIYNDNGTVIYDYEKLGEATTDASIGVQNVHGGKGLQLANFNFDSGFQIKFYQGYHAHSEPPISDHLPMHPLV